MQIPPRVGETLEACRDVHSVTVYDTTVLDHVTKVHADAKAYYALIRQALVPLGELRLNSRGTGNRIDDRVELGQHSISRVVHHLAVMGVDRGGNQVEVFAQTTVRGVLVLTRQAAVIGDICVENRGEPTW